MILYKMYDTISELILYIQYQCLSAIGTYSEFDNTYYYDYYKYNMCTRVLRQIPWYLYNIIPILAALRGIIDS